MNYASEQLRWHIWPTFPLNFFMKFSQKMPLYFFNTMVQKSQKWPKTQIKGGGPALSLPKISGYEDAASVTSLVPGHIGGCRMILKLTMGIRLTMSGHLQSDSGWSWTLQICYVTLQGCEVAPIVSQSMARDILSRLPAWMLTSDLYPRVLLKDSDQRWWFFSLIDHIPYHWILLG